MNEIEIMYPNSETELYPEITYHEAIRETITPEFADLSDAEIDLMLGNIFAGMSPEEIEGIWGSLGNLARGVGRTLVRAAPKILPIAGGALGTLIGGPAGTAIGAKLGGVAGRLVGSAGGSRRRRRRPAAKGKASAVPAGGSSATAQLLSLLSNPDLLRSLLSRLLGSGGRTEVVSQGEVIEVDCGSFLNALGELASEAALEAQQDGVAAAGMPEYLLDQEGVLLEGADRPEARAELLLELLHDSEAQQWFGELETPEAWLIEAGFLQSQA